MDINIVDELISELKTCDTTYNNVRDLAALYTVKDKLEEDEKTEESKELFEILPAYKHYINEKRKFQLGESDKDHLQAEMKLLCIEIFDFVAALYRNTNTQEERQEIMRCISRINEEL